MTGVVEECVGAASNEHVPGITVEEEHFGGEDLINAG
jgi:hypothetical protein